MAEIYLEPKDIGEADTQKVLAFLNTVASADEIATSVEIPDELDIGEKLGQRILNARAELGGRFDNLSQLYAVPLIGPERFTEIITEITGKSALNILSAQIQSGEQVASLTAQAERLSRLLQQMEELDPKRFAIELSVRDDIPYLGEVIPIRVRVWDRHRLEYKANMPVTVETNWGHLRWSRGYSRQQGAVVHSKTRVSGEITCDLYTNTVEPLTEPQQYELSNALRKLDHGGKIPENVQESLQQMVTRYQHPLNVDLRSAVDIHYRSRQQRLAETVNFSASLYSWQYEQALIRVYLHPSESKDSTTVIAMAAITVELRDWLSPWFQVYKQALLGADGLNETINNALTYSEDEKDLVNHVVSGVHSFIAGQNGLVGERVGQQASREIITKLMKDKAVGLSNTSQATLYTVLNEAPTSITARSKGSIAVANEVAVDVGRNQGVYEAVAKVDSVTQQIDSLNASVNNINSRVTDFETATSGIDFHELNDNLSQFNTQYSSFMSEVASFHNEYSQFEDHYSSFQTNYSQFNNQYADWQSGYATFNEDLTGFETDLESFNKGVATFNAAKDQLINNVTAGVNAALNEVGTSSGVAIHPIENVELDSNLTHRPGRGG